MPVTFVGNGGLADATWPNTSGSQNSAVPIHASTAAGDYMLLFAWCRRDVTLTGPGGGWVEVFNEWGVPGDAAGQTFGIFEKFHDGSEADPAITWGSGAGPRNAFILSYRDVDPTTPIDQMPAGLSANASAQDIGPIAGFTPASTVGAIIVFGGKADDWTSVATLTGESLTWAEIVEEDTLSGNDGGIVLNHALDWISGAIANKTFTVTGGASNIGAGLMFGLNAAGGTVHALAGAAAAQASAAGIINVARPLAGSAAAQSSGAGLIGIRRGLGGSAAAQASASGILRAIAGLAGSAAAQSSASGDLTGVRRFAGSAAAQASASGELTAALALAGSAGAQSSASGALALIAALAGSAAAQSSAAGELTTGTFFAGSASAQASASGVLTLNASLAGSAAAQAGAAGALGITRGFAGIAAALASASGDLTVSGPFNASPHHGRPLGAIYQAILGGAVEPVVTGGAPAATGTGAVPDGRLTGAMIDEVTTGAETAAGRGGTLDERTTGGVVD